MCCEHHEAEDWPAPVAHMIDRYRAMAATRSPDWGAELPLDVPLQWRYEWLFDPIELQAHLADLETRLMAVLAGGTSPSEATAVLPRPPRVLDPAPTAVALVDDSGVELGVPLPYACEGGSVTYVVATVEDRRPRSVDEVVVEAGDPHLRIGGQELVAVEVTPSATVRLVSSGTARWSVVDERGGAWFPACGPRKRDVFGRPFFHGDDVTVVVPAVRLTVTVSRGVEFRPTTIDVDPVAGVETAVEIEPERLYDAAVRGWYGGDLHVHMNYSGHHVCTPDDAARMQRGEGLHLMNLVAANMTTSTIYDREAFEHYAGRDLPWTDGDRVARFGVEYRNDMLGHFHALNPSGPPVRYNSGHARSDQPQDWPPNAVAAAEARALGATVGYAHPVLVPLDDDGSPGPVFAETNRPHARELVADAALGLVDSVDLTGLLDLGATEQLYHRLLGCGLRLAATAGTDTMLSHGRGPFSNPPGWARAYADLDGRPLSVEAWQDAVRAGRTFATTGPWVELSVDGHGPGAVLTWDGPGSVEVVARVVGLGVTQLELVGPEGCLATTTLAAGAEQGELQARVDLDEPTWLAVVARGGPHPAMPAPAMYAHTSPVWVDIAGRAVARPDDARWCLDWLDRFEKMVRSSGTFTAPGQLDELVDVVDRARAFYRPIAG